MDTERLVSSLLIFLLSRKRNERHHRSVLLCSLLLDKEESEMVSTIARFFFAYFLLFAKKKVSYLPTQKRWKMLSTISMVTCLPSSSPRLPLASSSSAQAVSEPRRAKVSSAVFV